MARAIFALFAGHVTRRSIYDLSPTPQAHLRPGLLVPAAMKRNPAGGAYIPPADIGGYWVNEGGRAQILAYDDPVGTVRCWGCGAKREEQP